MKVRLPWHRDTPLTTTAPPAQTACTHPHVEVEMRGTAIKRRWCSVCGQELPVEERWSKE